MASEIRVNSLTNRSGLSTVSITDTGAVIAGMVTATDAIFTGDITTTNGTFSGNISIGGTLTYEDVTNIDAVGVITARSDVSIADKILHTGDTNTAIRFPAADTFTVETAGSERLRITSAGNIGIGENTPETLLHLSKNGGQATITLEDPSNSMKATLSAGTTRLDVGTPGSHDISFFTNNTHRLRITSGGQLLLGTTTEGHVSADDFTVAGSGDVGITIRSGTGSEGSIMFSDGTSGADEYRGWINYNQNSNFMRFFTNATERLRIDSAGRLGLGANNNSSYDAIGQNFLIANESSHAGMTIRSGGSGAFGAIHFADGVSNNNEKRAGRILYSHDSDFMSFHTANAERLRIDSNGSAQFTGANSPSGRNTRISQYGSLLVGTTGEILTNARCSIDAGNGNIATEGAIAASSANLQSSSTSSWFQTGTSIASYPYVWAAKNSSSNTWHSGLQTDGDLYLGGNLASTNNIGLIGSTGSGWFSGGLGIGGFAAANTIDEYEEGTWTPSIRENGTSTAWNTLSNQVGTYTRVGRLVTVNFKFDYSARATNVTQSYYGWIAGLPFQNTTSNVNEGAGTLMIAQSGGSNTPYHIYLISSQGNTLGVYKNQDSASPGPMMTSEWPNAACQVRGQFMYYV